MKFKINAKEVWSGGLLVLIGMATTLGSLNYQIGTLARMGPGYFPLMLGIILMVLGLIVLISPDMDRSSADDGLDKLGLKAQLMTWGLVISSVALFAILGKYGGLVPATFFLTFVAALADHKNTWKVALAVSVVLTAFTVGVFYYGLQMQLPLFVWG